MAEEESEKDKPNTVQLSGRSTIMTSGRANLGAKKPLPRTTNGEEMGMPVPLREEASAGLAAAPEGGTSTRDVEVKLTGVEAKAEVGALTPEIAVGLQGVAAKAEVGRVQPTTTITRDFSMNVETGAEVASAVSTVNAAVSDAPRTQGLTYLTTDDGKLITTEDGTPIVVDDSGNVEPGTEAADTLSATVEARPLPDRIVVNPDNAVWNQATWNAANWSVDPDRAFVQFAEALEFPPPWNVPGALWPVMLARAEQDIDAVIAAVQVSQYGQSKGMLGHNMPPMPLDEADVAGLETAKAGIVLLRKLVEEGPPDKLVVDLVEKALQAAGATFLKFGKWFLSGGKHYLDNILEGGTKKFGEEFGAGLARSLTNPEEFAKWMVILGAIAAGHPNWVVILAALAAVKGVKK